MIEKGQYQNSVLSLSSLSIIDYERIFKVFKSSIEDKEFYYYNILKKIEFPTIDSSFLNYYEVPSRMPLTIISYELYGDIKSWWIIYLMNKDKFDGVPFFVEGGTQLSYILDGFRTAIYTDITQATVFGGRHY
jgi:hypothetical protein